MTFIRVSKQRKISNLKETGIQYLPGHEERFMDKTIDLLGDMNKSLNILELGGGGLRFALSAIGLNNVEHITIVEPDYYSLDYRKIIKLTDLPEHRSGKSESKCTFFIGTVQSFLSSMKPRINYDVIASFRMFHFFDPGSLDNIMLKLRDILCADGLLVFSGISSGDYNNPGEKNLLFNNSSPIKGQEHYRTVNVKNEEVLKTVAEQNLPRKLLFLDEVYVRSLMERCGFEKVLGPCKATRIVDGYIFKKVI
jgi:hypothetical protein